MTTTIIGFEGSIVPNAAGILAVVAKTSSGFEVIRCTPALTRTPLSTKELEQLLERGLLHRLENEAVVDADDPVLLSLPERWLWHEPWPPNEWLHWVKRRLGPSQEVGSGTVAVVLSRTSAFDVLRLFFEEVLAGVRLQLRPTPSVSEARLFLRSASAILNDPNARERVFATLFADAVDDPDRWNALLRDAKREFSDDAIDRIKFEATRARRATSRSPKPEPDDTEAL